MQQGSLVYFHKDEEKQKRLYIVSSVEENPFNYARGRINVVCCRTAKHHWFFRHEMKEMNCLEGDDAKNKGQTSHESG